MSKGRTPTAATGYRGAKHLPAEWRAGSRSGTEMNGSIGLELRSGRTIGSPQDV